MSLFQIRPQYLVGAACRDVLEEVKAVNAENTYEAYVFHARRVEGAFGSKRPLASITLDDLAAYQVKRLGEASRSTVNQEFGFISRLYKTAIRKGHAKSNPALSLRRLKCNNERERWLSESEERSLLLALKEHNDVVGRMVVKLLVLTGLRRMELFGMMKSQVDLPRGEVCLPRAKGGRRRWVPLNRMAKRLLSRLMKRSPNNFVVPSVSRSDNRSVLVTTWYTGYFKKAAAVCGFPELRIHDLRHTFASRLVNKGVDLYALAELLGHSDVKMTRRYAHLCHRRLRDVIELAE